MIKLYFTTIIALVLIVAGLWFLIVPEAYQKYFIAVHERPSRFWISRIVSKFAIINAKGWWGRTQIRIGGMALLLIGSYVIFVLFFEYEPA